MADVALSVDLVDLLTAGGVEGDSVELLRNITPSKTPDVKEIFAPISAPTPPAAPSLNFEEAAAAVEEYLSDEERSSPSNDDCSLTRASLSREDLLCLQDIASASDYEYAGSEVSNAVEFLLDQQAVARPHEDARAELERAREATERAAMGRHDLLLNRTLGADDMPAPAQTKAQSQAQTQTQARKSNSLTCRNEPDNIFRIEGAPAERQAAEDEEVKGLAEGDEVEERHHQEDAGTEPDGGALSDCETELAHKPSVCAAEHAPAAAVTTEETQGELACIEYVSNSSATREARHERQRSHAAVVANATAAFGKAATAARETVARLREKGKAQRAAEAVAAALAADEGEDEEARRLAIASAPPVIHRRSTGEMSHSAVEDEKNPATQSISPTTPAAHRKDSTVAAQSVTEAQVEGTGQVEEMRVSRRHGERGEVNYVPDRCDRASVNKSGRASRAHDTERDAPRFEWGTVLQKLGADMFCAATAAAAVSPFVGAIDKAVVQSVSGSASIMQSLQSSFTEMAVGGARSVVAAPQFRFLFVMYSGTYATANMIRTVYEVRDADPSLSLCVGTTVVNTYLSLVKDRALAQIFGASASASAGVPVTAYGSWMGRDAVTMGMVFTAPPKASAALQSFVGWSPSTSDTVATLAIPVVIQPLTTAMHLMGIDLVNRPSNVALSSRLGVMGKSYAESLVARTGRIFVPYSVGSLLNTKMRSFLHKMSSSWKMLLPDSRNTPLPSMAK